MDPIIILSICVAGAIGAAGYFLASMLMGNKDGRIRSRLEKKNPIDGRAEVATERKSSFKPVLQKIGSAAAEPFMPKNRETQSSLRKQLAHAGIYSHNAVRLVTGAKVILLIVGLMFGYLLGTMTGSLFLWLPIGGLGGYLGPMFWCRSQPPTSTQAARSPMLARMSCATALRSRPAPVFGYTTPFCGWKAPADETSCVADSALRAAAPSGPPVDQIVSAHA